MPSSSPTERAVHPKEQALGEMTVPEVPAGSARWTLGLLSLMPAALVTMGIVYRLSGAFEPGTGIVPLVGIYGLIGANLAVALFAVLAMKSPYLDPLQRIGWAIALIALAPITLPAFWYRIVMHPMRYGTPPEKLAHRPLMPRVRTSG